ncbi:MAG: hypothetical protein ACO1NX_02695 [Chitinophagaceae bacterium]
MSRIKTNEDLELEKARLTALLKNHEEAIRYDMAGVREGLKPVNTAVKFINKMATRDNTTPVMNFGLEMGIDLLVRRFILRRAGWVTKIVVPYLVKNYSSHIIGEEKREALLAKIRGFFNKVRPKPNEEDEATVYSREAAAAQAAAESESAGPEVTRPSASAPPPYTRPPGSTPPSASI